MGVCSYLGCKNRSEDGFQFGSFPAKDKSRRNLWLKNCNYKVNNVDSPNIKLCHAHFEDKMWYYLGPRRRLRPDAIPTIFNSYTSSTEDPSLKNVLQSIKKDPEAEVEITSKVADPALGIENRIPSVADCTNLIVEGGQNKSSEFLVNKNSVQDQYTLMDVIIKTEESENLVQDIQTSEDNATKTCNEREDNEESNDFEEQTNANLVENHDFLSQSSTQKENWSATVPAGQPQENSIKDVEVRTASPKDVDSQASSSQLLKQLKEMQKREQLARERNERMDKILAKEMKSKEYFKKKYYSCLNRLKAAEKKLSAEDGCEISDFRKILNNRFSQDQADAIIHSHKRYPKWSNETLMLGQRLRSACGTSGYEQLLKEKFPLPSIRTLTRHAESSKLPAGENQEIQKSAEGSSSNVKV